MVDALPVEGERVTVLAWNAASGGERTDGSRSLAGGCVADGAVRNGERNGGARL